MSVTGPIRGLRVSVIGSIRGLTVSVNIFENVIL